MSDLRDRIAAIYEEHCDGCSFCYPEGNDGSAICGCGERLDSGYSDYPKHLADVLIRELGWREERRNFDTLFANRAEPQRRYVTDWEAE